MITTRILVLLLMLICLLVFAGCAEETVDVMIEFGPEGDPERGRELVAEYGCPACHTIPGIRGAESKVGPPLTAWSERRYIAGSLANTEENLIRWIIDPQAVEPGTAMPDMGIGEGDAQDIAAYLYTLGDGRLEDEWPGVAGVVEQPIPFSHQYHVAGLGLDCRYCHASVEKSPFAGMPSTHTCMTCHSHVWTEVPLLATVRESWEEDKPIPWVRIYDLAEFTFFNHAIHLNSGVGCDVCHGRVDQMLLTEPAVTYTMAWCLECHREPQRFLRPREEVFNLAWQPPDNQIELGTELVESYDIPVEILTDCSLCHH
ncbi:MAG TPA: cytochrome c3 family protein [Anaerolineae bacterium]